jgi:hypothetical protein
MAVSFFLCNIFIQKLATDYTDYTNSFYIIRGNSCNSWQILTSRRLNKRNYKLAIKSVASFA